MKIKIHLWIVNLKSKFDESVPWILLPRVRWHFYVKALSSGAARTPPKRKFERLVVKNVLIRVRSAVCILCTHNRAMIYSCSSFIILPPVPTILPPVVPLEVVVLSKASIFQFWILLRRCWKNNKPITLLVKLQSFFWSLN